MTNSAETLPLKGVKVLDLTHLIAAPYAAQLFADQGAEVIKVEAPNGELARAREPKRGKGNVKVSAFYAALNRGKESIALDLKTDAGKEIFRKLLEWADVLVTNYRAAALDRLGFHPEQLRKEYPRLIISVISGFGLKDAGEYADRAGLAMVGEALSGATGMTRDHNNHPVWCGYALGDVAAGMTMHSSVLLALRQQEKYGTGRLIDLTLPECLLPMLTVAFARYEIAKSENPDFDSSNTFHGIPYGAFRAKDGSINLGVNSDALWKKFCKGIGRLDLADHPDYATYIARTKLHDEIFGMTEEFTLQHTRAELTAIFSGVDVPVASILSIDEVMEDEYFKRRGSFRLVDDGVGGTLRLPADPNGFDDRTTIPAIPVLGQHRTEVLQRLNYTTEQQKSLEAAGAFGA